ncbi:hypothetical protein ACJX0J_041958, partial [Zea mays]
TSFADYCVSMEKDGGDTLSMKWLHDSSFGIDSKMRAFTVVYILQVCFPRIIVVLSISAAATNRIGYLLLKRWLYMPSFMMVSLQEVSGSSPTEVQNFCLRLDAIVLYNSPQGR